VEIKRKTPFLARQNFGELLDNAFKMMGQTWRTSLLLAVILLLPLSALLGWGLVRFLVSLADLPDLASKPLEALGAFYLRFLMSFSAGALLLQFAGLFAYVGVSTHVVAVAEGRKPVFGEIMRLAGRRFYGRCILQYLVQIAVVVGIMTVAVLLVVPPLLFSLSGQAPVAAVAGTSGALLLGAMAAIWLTVLLRFAPQAVVFDGETVFGSLQHSARLVHGSWWRLFGISIVLTIIFSFAVGLATFPLSGTALLPLVSRLIGMVLSGSFEASQAADLVRGGATWIAVASAGSIFIQAALEVFFMPAFFGQFYIDLKVRKGELETARRRPGQRGKGR
jgi:hypothetical protein